jgi:hypothetical protein
MGVAVISGNLPLLAPVFERILGRNTSTRGYYYYGSSGRDGDRFALNYHQGPRLHDGSVSRGSAQTLTILASTSYNFERFSDTDQGVQPRLGDMELDDRAILVKTEVDVISDPVDSGSEARATIEGKTRLQTK